jgi:hypothetical protein
VTIVSQAEKTTPDPTCIASTGVRDIFASVREVPGVTNIKDLDVDAKRQAVRAYPVLVVQQ